jgi:L-lactate dehydrogenase complex protein LldF
MWAWLARRPLSYRLMVRFKMSLLRLLVGKRGRFTWFIGAGGWTKSRDLPAPQAATKHGGTFMDRYQRGER